MRAPIVQFRQVGLRYGEREVLSNVSFTVYRSEFVYLIGRTGAGKSSLLRMLYADVLPTEGSVTIDSYDLATIKRDQIPFLRRRLGIVFQDFQLLPDRTVGQNIEFALRATGWKNKQEITNRVTEVLMLVGLSSKINSLPHQLSGGEQQRTVIARALVNDPVALVADEPTGNLDPEVTEHIMEILRKVNQQGTAVIMCTHEHSLLARYPARVIEVKNGGIIDHAPPLEEELMEAELAEAKLHAPVPSRAKLEAQAAESKAESAKQPQAQPQAQPQTQAQAQPQTQAVIMAEPTPEPEPAVAQAAYCPPMPRPLTEAPEPVAAVSAASLRETAPPPRKNTNNPGSLNSPNSPVEAIKRTIIYMDEDEALDQMAHAPRV